MIFSIFLIFSKNSGDGSNKEIARPIARAMARRTYRFEII